MCGSQSLDLEKAQLLSQQCVIIVNYVKIQLQETVSGCNGSALSGFLLLILISHFKFSFLEVLVQLPFGNNKVAIRYDKGMEQTQLLIAIVKEKRWVYEPIKKTCKMEWAAGPYEKCIQIFAKCIFGHLPIEILSHFLLSENLLPLHFILI